jgi:hypothetical protein
VVGAVAGGFAGVVARVVGAVAGGFIGVAARWWAPVRKRPLFERRAGYVPDAPDCTVCTVRTCLALVQVWAEKLTYTAAVWLGG